MTAAAEDATAGLAFLRARELWPDGLPRCTGRSSDALAHYGLGWRGAPITPTDPRPYDEGDLRACQLTYALAPVWAQLRMRPVLDDFEAWVAHDRDRATT